MGDFNRFDKFICKNATFVPSVLDGRIKPNMSGIREVSGRAVCFNNGDRVEADVIVLCTGFRDRFTLLTNVTVPENDVRNLYKHAFHPDVGGSLAFIGWARPLSGGIP